MLQQSRLAYQHDIKHFLLWGGLLPANESMLVQYLEAYASTLNPRTLSRRLTAIRQWHVMQTFPDPTVSPRIKKLLSGIKNVHGQPKRRAKAITLEVLARMVGVLEQKNSVTSKRDKALLLVGFFAALRRSELVALRWDDIDYFEEGITLTIRASKTDQAHEGNTVALPKSDSSLCPIKALAAWQACQPEGCATIFSQIKKGGHIQYDAIKAGQVNSIIKALAYACNLPDPELYSGHSLRRGFATSGAAKGVAFGALKRQGRWKTETTVLQYFEEGRQFEDNAVNQLLQNIT